MSWTFTTSGAAILKAGNGANSTITNNYSGLTTISDEVEDLLCSVARYDLVTNYSSLTTNGKKLLGQLASNMIAQKIIAYDIAAYPNSRTAETMLDVLENDVRRGLELLKEDKNRTFLGVETG